MSAVGQCPVITSDIQDQACFGLPFNVSNTSSNDLIFQWDFCDETLDTTSFSTGEIASVSNPQRLLDIAFADSTSVWYGFATSWASDEVLRFKFSDGIENSPNEVVSLGVLGSIDQPISIETFRQNDIWYALVYSWTGTLTRLDFLNGLENPPQATTIVDEIGQSLSKMHLASAPNELKIVIVNPTNTLTIVDLKNDITYEPAAEDINTSSPIAGLSSARDIEIFKECDQWYGYISSYSSGTITRVNFGDTISTTIEDTGGLIANYFGGNINRIGLMRSGNSYYLQVLTFAGKLFNVTIGPDPLVTGLNSTSVSQYGEAFVYGQGYTLRSIKDNGTWKGLVLNDLSGTFYQITYEADCSANLQASQEKEPEGIFYSEPGTYIISLEATDEFGSVDFVSEEITILDETIQQIDWLTTNKCIDSESSFEIVGDTTGLTFNWDFTGDEIPDEIGATLTIDLASSYGFQPDLTYPVMLKVTNSAGCELIVSKDIRLHESPIALFSTSTLNQCTDNLVEFTNESVYSTDSGVVWNWDFDGDGIIDSNDRSPVFAYDTPGEKLVSLIAELPDACSSISEELINILPGPNVEFSWSNNCVDSPINFLILSDPGTILWDFGDGTTSSETNPSHQYASTGTYVVELTVVNDLECSTTLAKNVEVNAVPVADFNYDILCQGSESVFEDLSVVDQADVTAWQWSVDGEVRSDLQSPGLTFDEARDYTISLLATSSDGCQSTYEEVVSIGAIPAVDFGIDIGCINESTVFNDLTEQSSVLSRSWMINDQSSNDPNPSEIFNEAGEYEASLTITNNDLCSSSITKAFTIDELPVPQFVIDGACNNEPIDLDDTSVDFADPIAIRSWSVDSEVIGEGLSATLTGYQPGSYNVSLETTTENGCVVMTSQHLEIRDNPTASFVASNDYGVPPFQLNFTNGSTNVSVNEWYVNDQLITTNPNPLISFSEAGEQLVSLVTYNSFGCADTASMIISSVMPVVDLVVSDIQLEESGNEYTIVLDVSNDSNLPIEALNVNVELQNQFTVTEQVFQRINAGDQALIALNTSVPVKNDQLGYLCVSLNSTYAQEEINQDDNEACINVQPNINVEDPFPNPVFTETTLRYILPESAKASLELFDMSGNLEILRDFETLPKGLNTIKLELTDLDAGMYIVRFSYQGNAIISRLIKL